VGGSSICGGNGGCLGDVGRILILAWMGGGGDIE